MFKYKCLQNVLSKTILKLNTFNEQLQSCHLGQFKQCDLELSKKFFHWKGFGKNLCNKFNTYSIRLLMTIKYQSLLQLD